MKKPSPLVILSYLIFSLGLTGCQLKIPGIPTWTIETIIPINQRTYRLSELATDSLKLAEQGWGIRIDENDSTLFFEYYDTIDYQEVGDKLTYNPSDTANYLSEVGIIHINEPSPEGDTVLIIRAAPHLTPGWTGQVSPFQLETLQDTLTYDVFEWLRINQGWLFVSINNDYPFPLDDITVALTDPQDNSPLGSFFFDNPIAPSESRIDSLDLSGSFVRNTILLEFSGYSPGTDNVITVQGDETMTLVVRIGSVEADSARAEIGAQDFTTSDALLFDDPNRLQEALIAQGSAKILMSNTTNLRLNATMVFENLFDEEGHQLQREITLDPKVRNREYELDLGGALITTNLAEPSLQVHNSAVIEDSRITRYQGRTYQTVASAQGIAVDYWTEGLTFAWFTGVIDSVQVDIPRQDTEIDLPEGLDSLYFTRDTLFLTLYNETSAPTRLDLSLVGVNRRTGRRALIPFNMELAPGRNDVFNPQVAEISNISPDKIYAEGAAGLGRKYFPDQIDSVATISASDRFYGNIRMKSGLKLSMGQMTLTSELVELEECVDHPFEDVQIHMDLVNSVPLKGVVKLLVGNNPRTMDTLMAVELPRGAIVNHRVQPAASSAAKDLYASDLEIFKRLPLFTQQIISLESTSGDTVWMHSQDSVAVKVSLEGHILVDIKEWQEGDE